MFRTERKKMGLTQAQLADKLWVSTATVNNWETGKTRPQKRYIYSLIGLGFSEAAITSLFSW